MSSPIAEEPSRSRVEAPTTPMPPGSIFLTLSLIADLVLAWYVSVRFLFYSPVAFVIGLLAVRRTHESAHALYVILALIGVVSFVLAVVINVVIGNDACNDGDPYTYCAVFSSYWTLVGFNGFGGLVMFLGALDC
eukprot:m.45125 g.45125  ORF g.45125 m.45125 type:complete len:135 (-) comp10868_c0_seq2:136-540(-)